MRRHKLAIRQEGTCVLFIVDGRLVLTLPWEAALDLARGITIKARAAEEIAKVERVIADQALLIRTGAPIGLTNNPDIQAEAAKEAVSSRDLRRYLPGGVKSEEKFGRPTVIRHPPRRKR